MTIQQKFHLFIFFFLNVGRNKTKKKKERNKQNKLLTIENRCLPEGIWVGGWVK